MSVLSAPASTPSVPAGQPVSQLPLALCGVCVFAAMGLSVLSLAGGLGHSETLGDAMHPLLLRRQHPQDKCPPCAGPRATPNAAVHPRSLPIL